MPYTIAWNESVPAGTALASLLWQFIQQKQIATRERLDDIFDTAAGPISITTADPYRIGSIKMGATSVSKIIPGDVSFAIRDSTDAENNFIIEEDGDATIRGRLTILKSASAARQLIVAQVTTNINLHNGNFIDLNLGLTITQLNLNNPVTGAFYTIKINNAGTFSINWPVNVLWPGGTPPVLTTSGTDIVSMVYDGVNFNAVISGLNFS